LVVNVLGFVDRARLRERTAGRLVECQGAAAGRHHVLPRLRQMHLRDQLPRIMPCPANDAGNDTVALPFLEEAGDKGELVLGHAASCSRSMLQRCGTKRIATTSGLASQAPAPCNSSHRRWNQARGVRQVQLLTLTIGGLLLSADVSM